MKTGRNAPCPCGSGKKYKKCCLGKKAAPSQALYYRRLSEAHDSLVDRLLPYAVKQFGEEAMEVAMDEFLLWPEPDDDISKEMLDRIGPLFWPWFLFNWEYNRIDTAIELTGPENRTVAEIYAADRRPRLSPLESKLIAGINRKPYSFHEVLSVDPGKSMHLQNILTGARINVQERTGSEYVQPGDLLFGRAVAFDGVGMLIGLGTTLMPPGEKPNIIRFRKQLHRGREAITEDTLYDWDAEIRETYLSVDRALHTPPQLVNTDGEPLEFHRLIYEVSSAEVTFEKLCDLCTTLNAAELREDAEKDKAGRVKSVEIPWTRDGDKKSTVMANTLLGQITITGRKMTATVNSAKRAGDLRRQIKTRLGDSARFKVDEIQSMDAMMDASGTAKGIPAPGNQNELMQLPEIQQQIADMISSHWENWIHQKLPALEGKTPLEAVKSSDGREAVEALLREAERDRDKDPLTLEANRKGTQQTRKRLGL